MLRSNLVDSRVRVEPRDPLATLRANMTVHRGCHRDRGIVNAEEAVFRLYYMGICDVLLDVPVDMAL